ncbi:MULTISPECIES: hypothetical protein [unclassified Streptomyces]|uniref:hypothetical protein n=1 Tax=unclassified Streptomyces TaxID=2593676 RepID=UPI00382F1202|nr:hypothetical protein OG770_25990 [Streptomyces sp. NBC_01185]
MRSREYDQDFRDRAGKTRVWGLVLLSLAALLWAWCAVLLLMPYEVDEVPDDDYPAECEARLFTDRGTANEGVRNGDHCADERDWPEAIAVLGVSLPVSITGVGLFTIGTVTRRMSAHSQAIRELDKLAEKSKG